MKRNIYLDGIFGVVVGDAFGVPVEFQTREQLRKSPVKDMREYGTYKSPRLEGANLMTNGVMGFDSDLESKCRDVIFLLENANISKKLGEVLYENMGPRKKRFIFVGKNRIPDGFEGMSIIEIRPEKRSNMPREEGIEIEMLGPDCTGLTRMCLRYKNVGRMIR